MPALMRSRRGKKPITARLLEGERLWLATEEYETVQRHIGLYSHIRRHGRYLHICRSYRDGQAGIEMWVDDDPSTVVDRKTRLDDLGFESV